MFKRLFIVGVAIVLTACATNKDWAATGGSKSDGVVRLSYELAELETPILNEKQAIDLATKRCQSWGYKGAEAFGGTTRQCVTRGGLGCALMQVTKEYQCTS
jgi:hypothetical protein